MAESLLVGRKFVSGICKLKSKKPLKLKKTFKNVKKLFLNKNLGFYQPCYIHIYTATRDTTCPPPNRSRIPNVT